MIRTEHTQTVTDFRANYAQTLDRLNRTGDAELLTQGGEARAVMLSPKAFDELSSAAELVKTIVTIQQSEAEIAEGKGRLAEGFFDDLRTRLLNMQAKQA